MKNQILFVILIFFAFAKEKISAQDFAGIATYKTRRAVDIKMDSTNMNDEMLKTINEQLKKQFEKEYKLQFTAKESLYTENEKLNKPDVAAQSGFQIKVTGNSDILYKNTQQQTYTRQQELMGKFFIIQDSLKQPKWDLSKDTKFIGDYMCFKATRDESYTVTHWDSDLEGEPKEETKQKTITVWYTPQIPVNNGPSKYWGLPGLILEVQDDKLSILCSSVVLNPQNTLSIEAPDRGKIVDEKTFDEIQKEKSREMMERYSGGKKSGDRTISIKIGG